MECSQSILIKFCRTQFMNVFIKSHISYMFNKKKRKEEEMRKVRIVIGRKTKEKLTTKLCEEKCKIELA